MSGRLNGKVAIITGAGSRGPGLGNGKATAILFAREGARIFCVDQVKAAPRRPSRRSARRAARRKPMPPTSRAPLRVRR
jgi:NAD(P)-dependent dehydrogenase (short-subunit alcohol dehydrogenase family)